MSDQSPNIKNRWTVINRLTKEEIRSYPTKGIAMDVVNYLNRAERASLRKYDFGSLFAVIPRILSGRDSQNI